MIGEAIGYQQIKPSAMKQKMHVWKLLIIGIICFCVTVKVQAQYSYFDITPVNGKFAFNYNQVPDALVPFNPAFPLATQTSYRWESSPTLNESDFINTDVQ